MPLPCVYGPIRYGDYTFNGYTKASLNCQNVYSEDGLIVKYHRYTLEADLIISQELITTAVPTVAGIDEEVENIRNYLQKPHRQLDFAYHGAGISLRIAGDMDDTTDGDLDTATQLPLHVEYNLIDGPFPEVMTWEPLGINNAARCRWRCVFILPVNNAILTAGKVNLFDIAQEARTNAGLRTINEIFNAAITSVVGNKDPDLDSDEINKNYVLSFTEEQEITIEDDGTTTVSFIGVIEFTGSGAAFIEEKGERVAIPRMLQLMCHYFEPYHMPGFTRSQKYKYRKSKREIEFIITDREQKSDNPLLPNIIKADVTHSVGSSLISDDVFKGAGFLTWENTFEGTITVSPGVWMGWAWIAMMTIVNQRMNRTNRLTGTVDTVKDEADGTLNPSAQWFWGDKEVKPKHILTKISIKEKIYSREVSFDLAYMVISNLDGLFKNTGLFYPVHISWVGQDPLNDVGKVPDDVINTTPKSYKDQWLESNVATAAVHNVFGYRGPLLNGYNILFDPYDVNDANSQHFTNPPRNPEEIITGPNAALTNNNITQFAYRRRAANTRNFIDKDIITQFPFPFLQNEETANPADRGPGLPPGVPAGTIPGSPVYQGGIYSGSNVSNWAQYADPKETWIDYKTSFQLVRNSNSVMMPSIRSVNPQSVHNEQIYPTATTAAWKGFTMGGRDTPYESSGSGLPNVSNYQYDDVQVFGMPLTFVRFRGSAMRALYGIPTPTLVGANAMGQPIGSPTLVKAYQVGNSVWNHAQVGISSDIPIFAASWDILYVLKGDPICANIQFQTASTPARYV